MTDKPTNPPILSEAELDAIPPGQAIWSLSGDEAKEYHAKVIAPKLKNGELLMVAKIHPQNKFGNYDIETWVKSADYGDGFRYLPPYATLKDAGTAIMNWLAHDILPRRNVIHPHEALPLSDSPKPPQREYTSGGESDFCVCENSEGQWHCRGCGRRIESSYRDENKPGFNRARMMRKREDIMKADHDAFKRKWAELNGGMPPPPDGKVSGDKIDWGKEVRDLYGGNDTTSDQAKQADLERKVVVVAFQWVADEEVGCDLCDAVDALKSHILNAAIPGVEKKE